MRRSPVDPTKATRRPSGVGGHTIRVGANRGRYPTATGRLESSTPATERAFLDQLSESSSPEVVKFAESVLEQVPAHDLTITWGEAGPLLRYEDETGHRFRFGKLSRRGTLGDTHWLCGQCLRRGLDASIYQRYLDQLAALIPGATHPEHIHPAHPARAEARPPAASSATGARLSRPRRDRRRERPPPCGGLARRGACRFFPGAAATSACPAGSSPPRACQRRPRRGKAVDHHAQQQPRFGGLQDRRLARPDDVGRPAHRGGRVGGHHLPGHQPIEQPTDGG